MGKRCLAFLLGGFLFHKFCWFGSIRLHPVFSMREKLLVPVLDMVVVGLSMQGFVGVVIFGLLFGVLCYLIHYMRLDIFFTCMVLLLYRFFSQ